MGHLLFRVRSVFFAPEISERIEGYWTRLDHVIQDGAVIIGEQTVTECGSRIKIPGFRDRQNRDLCRGKAKKGVGLGVGFGEVRMARLSRVESLTPHPPDCRFQPTSKAPHIRCVSVKQLTDSP